MAAFALGARLGASRRRRKLGKKRRRKRVAAAGALAGSATSIEISGVESEIEDFEEAATGLAEALANRIQGGAPKDTGEFEKSISGGVSLKQGSGIGAISLSFGSTSFGGGGQQARRVVGSLLRYAPYVEARDQVFKDGVDRIYPSLPSGAVQADMTTTIYYAVYLVEAGFGAVGVPIAEGSYEVKSKADLRDFCEINYNPGGPAFITLDFEIPEENKNNPQWIKLLETVSLIQNIGEIA